MLLNIRPGTSIMVIAFVLAFSGLLLIFMMRRLLAKSKQGRR